MSRSVLDYETVWEVVRDKLPELNSKLKKILSSNN
jgi:uncharacterized protein with HEPN domain